MFEICQLGLPLLRTLVVTAWNDNIAKQVEDYIRGNGWSQVMIRSDRRPEVPNSPRGGFLFDLASVPRIIQELLASGRIVLVIEPANKYDNLFAINVLFEPKKQEILLEIVGAGFDATDINRGDISPHERIRLEMKNGTVTTRIIKRESVSQEEYLMSVSQRLSKIGRENFQVAQRDNIDEPDFEEIGSQFLSSNGLENLNRHQYEPLPSRYLARLVSYIRDLSWQLPASGDDDRYVISLSILDPPQNPRFVFWDIVRPSRKYGWEKRGNR